MRDLRNRIEMTSEHITWMENTIADWSVIVADLGRAGCRTDYAENTLDVCVSALRTLETRLREEIKAQDGRRVTDAA